MICVHDIYISVILWIYISNKVYNRFICKPNIADRRIWARSKNTEYMRRKGLQIGSEKKTYALHRNKDESDGVTKHFLLTKHLWSTNKMWQTNVKCFGQSTASSILQGFMKLLGCIRNIDAVISIEILHSIYLF